MSRVKGQTYVRVLLTLLFGVGPDISILRVPVEAAISPFMSSLNPPNPWWVMMLVTKIDHNTGNYVPYSFRPTELYVNKVCETELTVYRPYPRRLESLIFCWCHYKDSTSSSVISRPWVLIPPVFTTSRWADRRYPNWPNRAAVTYIKDRLHFSLKLLLMKNRTRLKWNIFKTDKNNTILCNAIGLLSKYPVNISNN